MLKSIQEWGLLFIIVGMMVLIGNFLGYEVMPLDAVPGMLVLIVLSLIGLIMHKAIGFKKLPSIAYVGIISLVVTLPGFPGQEKIVEWTAEINVLAIATPILAYAGISIGRSWTDFAKLGWKTLIVGMFVIIGTYLGSAVIAEVVLRIQGII